MEIIIVQELMSLERDLQNLHYLVSFISYLKMKTRYIFDTISEDMTTKTISENWTTSYIFDTISEDMTPRFILDNKNNP
jgi:hypothetical protein